MTQSSVLCTSSLKEMVRSLTLCYVLFERTSPVADAAWLEQRNGCLQLMRISIFRMQLSSLSERANAFLCRRLVHFYAFLVCFCVRTLPVVDAAWLKAKRPPATGAYQHFSHTLYALFVETLGLNTALKWSHGPSQPVPHPTLTNLSAAGTLVSRRRLVHFYAFLVCFFVRTSPAVGAAWLEKRNGCLQLVRISIFRMQLSSLSERAHAFRRFWYYLRQPAVRQDGQNRRSSLPRGRVLSYSPASCPR